MARFAVLNDSRIFALMLAGPLREAGHEVLIETAPIDFERVVRFSPEAVVFGISRRPDALDRPIRDFGQDVIGHQALADMQRYPAIYALPVVIVATAVPPEALPPELPHDEFIGIPGDVSEYVARLEAIARDARPRRRLSGYACPHCRGRLLYHRRPEDLYCPRCATAVAVMDENALVMDKALARSHVGLEALEPPPLSKPEPGDS